MQKILAAALGAAVILSAAAPASAGFKNGGGHFKGHFGHKFHGHKFVFKKHFAFKNHGYGYGYYGGCYHKKVKYFDGYGWDWKFVKVCA